MTLLMSAMDEEMSLMLSKMEKKQEYKHLNFVYYKGVLHGKEVLIARCGIGKVLSAVATEYFLEKYDIKQLIFTGMAGSLSQDLGIGDILVAKDLVFYDVDVTAFGYKMGHIPQTEYRFIDGDAGLINIFSTMKLDCNIKIGRILTGDKFIKNKDEIRELNLEFKGDAVEMEGASVALVCKLHGVPFVIIRVISDMADGSAPLDFKDFLDTASKTTSLMIENFLK